METLEGSARHKFPQANEVAPNPSCAQGRAEEAAKQSGALFIDLNKISADKYDALGQDATKLLFNDFQHSRKAGAQLNAESVVTGIRQLNIPLAKDLAVTAPQAATK